MLLIVSASRSEFLLPKCLNSVFISRLRDCAWFYVWSGGEDVSQVCATSRAHESCCQRFEWQPGPTVSCLSLHSIFFHFQSPSLSFAPLSPSLCLSGCKVIKLSCFILDAIQRSDTLESWLWHALATHTHLTHTPFCAAQTSMCRGQVSFMFMLSISRRPALWLSDWREIIVIAALSHRDKRWIESWKHEFNLVFFYDIISSMIAFHSLALWVTDRLSQLWSNNII